MLDGESAGRRKAAHGLRALAACLTIGVMFGIGLVAEPRAAEIAFRGASSAAAPTGSGVSFRSASTGISSRVTFRGAATSGTTSIAPVFRAAQSGFSASGVLTLTITGPTGTIENDVMVAAIGVSGNTPTITAPAGWVLVRRIDNPTGTANSLAVYYKVATAVEPLSYNWSLSASGGSAGGIQSFYNVDILNPIDAENGQTTSVGDTHATPSITTSMANTMLVTAYTFASARSWMPPPLSPATPAMTERVDQQSGSQSNLGQSVGAHQGVIATAGVVPALAATAYSVGGSADSGNTHVLALKPALRVPRPFATAAGDLMIAAIGVQPSSASVTPPPGWVLVRRVDNAGPSSNSLAIYRKFAQEVESASYHWRSSGATDIVGGIQSYFGVDPTNPIDVEAGQATASSLTHTAPAVTTTVANAMLVGHYTYASVGNWTVQSAPPTMTENYDVTSQPFPIVDGQTLQGTRFLQATAGASAAFPSLASANADAGATHMMALRPAPGTIDPIGKPLGVVQNDVMIAAIGVTPSSVTITPPPGWTLIRRIDNTGGVSNALAVYYRVATNAEPAGYVWSFSNFVTAVGGIQAFSGVDTSTPIDAEAGQATPSSLLHTAPSITTTVANAMLVGHYTLSSATTFATQDPDGGGPLAAMFESFDVQMPPAGANGQTILGTRLVQAAAGASPGYGAWASAQADFGAAHLLALRPQIGTASLDLLRPPGTVANDVMIAAVSFQPHTLTITPPSGWNLVHRMDNASGTANSLAVYSRAAGGSEPVAYQWSFGGGTLTAAAGGIQSFAGVDTANPINVASGQATPSATGHATPSVTTTVPNTMLVTAHAIASSVLWFPVAGMTEGYDQASLPIPNAGGQTVSGSFQFQALAGATGAKTAGAQSDADTGNTHILALRPSAQSQTYFVHTDHLNTPRLITNNVGQPVWQWDNVDPFGNNAPNENPSSLGNFTCNLRFPGQYFDKETNLHYNYFRDYDPAIGRYIQSDPIGLDGGMNTYSYTDSNPLSRRDPTGLWSPEAHNYFIQQTFGNLPANAIARIAQGSAAADSGPYQTADFAYMHAMSSATLNKAQALEKYCDYISKWMQEYRKNVDRPRTSTRAYFALGMAMHAVMDSTSPAHAGFQQWKGGIFDPGTHGPRWFNPNSIEDINAAPAYLDATRTLMNNVLKGALPPECQCR